MELPTLLKANWGRSYSVDLAEGSPVKAHGREEANPYPREKLTIHQFAGQGDAMGLLRRDTLVVRNVADLQHPEHAGLLDNCLLVLPRSSVEFLRLCPNLEDKGDPQRLWFGRVWQLRSLVTKTYEITHAWKGTKEVSAEALELEERIRREPKLLSGILKIQAIWRSATQRRLWVLDSLEHTVNGLVIFMHGSGGMTGNNLRFARVLANLGYLVIAPDGMASSSYRRRDLCGLTKEGSATDYWNDNLVYSSSTSGEYAYNTQVETVLEDPQKYKALYEKVYRMRAGELHYVLQHLPTFVNNTGVFIMGTSEGAMTVARFDDQRYGPLINGRIISAFSAEYCYFTPTAEAGEFGGSLLVPTLQLIGSHDEYFGTQDSIAQLIAADPEQGYGSKNLLGHGFHTMKRQGMKTGCVCVFDEGRHDLTITADNVIRSILMVFLRRPSKIHELDKIWVNDPSLWQQIEVLDKQRGEEAIGDLLLLRVKKSALPQTIQRHKEKRLRRVHGWDHATLMKAHCRLQECMESDSKERASTQLERMSSCLRKKTISRICLDLSHLSEVEH